MIRVELEVGGETFSSLTAGPTLLEALLGARLQWYERLRDGSPSRPEAIRELLEEIDALEAAWEVLRVLAENGPGEEGELREEILEALGPALRLYRRVQDRERGSS